MRPFCRVPILTAGTPKNEHSLIPVEELPTRQAALSKSPRNSSEARYLTKRICDGLRFSRKTRIALETLSVPASTLGQNQIVGVFVSNTACNNTSVFFLLFSISLVTGCTITIIYGVAVSMTSPTPHLLKSLFEILNLFFAIYSISGQPTLNTYLGFSPMRSILSLESSLVAK